MLFPSDFRAKVMRKRSGCQVLSVIWANFISFRTRFGQFMATLWCKSGFILAVSTIFPFVLLILLPAVERTAYFVIDCNMHKGGQLLSDKESTYINVSSMNSKQRKPCV